MPKPVHEKMFRVNFTRKDEPATYFKAVTIEKAKTSVKSRYPTRKFTIQEVPHTWSGSRAALHANLPVVQER